MSFNSRESSLVDGQPVRLYQFSRGAIRWSYNSSDRDITYQNQVFRTVPGGYLVETFEPLTGSGAVLASVLVEVAK